MGRQGMFDDSGYKFNVPLEMCENCEHGTEKWDEYDHKYYKCEIGARDIDYCEYLEKEDGEE